MAYEISSSIAASTVALQNVNGSSTSARASGGHFSPDGTRLAVPVLATGLGGSARGIDIYTSSSASGWTATDFCPTTEGGTNRYALTVQWVNNSEIAVMLSGRGIATFTSSSSGWANGVRRTTTTNTSAFHYNPSKTLLAVYRPTYGGGDDYVNIWKSGSSQWTFGSQIDEPSGNGKLVMAVEWLSDTDIAVGVPDYDAASNQNQGEVTIWRTTDGGDSVSEIEAVQGTSNGDKIGASIYYHSASGNMIVGTGMPTANFASSTGNTWYLYQSTSAGGYVQANTDRTELTSVGESSGRVPAQFYKQEDNINNRFAIALAASANNQSDAEIMVWESGSSGWKGSIIDDDVYLYYPAAGGMSQVGISKLGAVANNNSVTPTLGNKTFRVRTPATGDTDAPTISSVAITSATNAQNSTLNEGDVVSVTVTFNEAVTVNTTGGTPAIAISVGGVSRSATYNSGTGTTAIVFTYTIASSETADTDGISIGANAISLNSGTMQDAAGNNATITHSAVSANSSFKVDTTKPTISSLSMAADNSTVTVTFAEDVYTSSNGTGNLTAADFTLGLTGGNAGSISLNATPSGISKTSQSIWVLTLNGTALDTNAAGTETLSVDAASNTAIYDLAGNAHTAAASTVSLNDTATLSDTETSTVGSSGGTVSAGGTNASPTATLTIPSDALSGNTSIGLDLEGDNDPKTNGVHYHSGEVGMDSYSKVIEVTPHAQEFSQAVTLSFKLEGSVAGSKPADLVIYKSLTADGPWFKLPSTYWSCSNVGVVTITATSFSRYHALGGNNMARTQLNNAQIAKLKSPNKALARAVDLTGSMDSTPAYISATDLFLLHRTGSETMAVSASVLQNFFSNPDIPDSGDADNTNYKVVFSPGGNGANLLHDTELTYNPSTDLLSAGSVTLNKADAGGDVAVSFAQGGTVAYAMGIDDSDSNTWKLHSAASLADSSDVSLSAAGVLTAASLVATTADINAGTVDATIGGTTPAAGTFTTLVANTSATVGSLVVTDDQIQMTPSTSDTVTIAAATNGALNITTVDDAGAAANLLMTIDGTAEIASAGLITLDSGAGIALEPAAGSAILLDGTISIDAGVVTGATSITSTAFVGALDGVIGGTTPAAATVTTLTVASDLIHDGDTNNKIAFGTDTQSFETGGSSRADLSDTGLRLGGANARVTTILDEDAFGSDSDTALATQQSIKAYVDANGGNFFLEDDDGTEVQITNSKEMKFIGSGLTTNWTDVSNGDDGDPYDLTFTVDAAQTGITSILATDLKIGEDNETKIDFETADEIHFYAANAEQVYVADGIFGPQTDSDVDLGSNAVRWKDAYVDSVTVTSNVTVGGNLTINGTTTTLNSTEVAIADKVFVAASGSSDAQIASAGGAGLAIGGDDGGAKKATFLYDGVDSWDLSDHLNLAASQEFKINNASVLSATTLGSAVVASSLTSVGTIASGVWNGTAIATAYIADDAVTNAKIADDAVDTENIADDAITAALIDDGAVGTAALADNGVTLAKMAGITRGSIILGDSSGDPSLLAKGSAAQLLQSDGTDPSYVTVSGDATIAAGGALTIASTAIESGMLNNNVISGQTELASDGLAAADELMISDAGTLKKIGVDNLFKDGPGLLGAGTIAAADDYIMFLDGGATGDAKTVQLSAVTTAIAGNGLAVSSGQLEVQSVQRTFRSGSSQVTSGNAVNITDNYGSAIVAASFHVYLNGMLQTRSGSLGADLSSVFDYTISGTTLTLQSAMDSDDVLIVSYIKNG